MTKALFAGSPWGQPTLCWVFMLSHIPIISQWQRQKLANVHQGASLLRAAPVKLSSRWDTVRYAPRRHVRWKETKMGNKEGSWSNKFLWRYSEVVSRSKAHVYLVNKGERWSPKINKFPRHSIESAFRYRWETLHKQEKNNPWKAKAMMLCRVTCHTQSDEKFTFCEVENKSGTAFVWLQFTQKLLIPNVPTQNWPLGPQIAINYDISWLQWTPLGDLTQAY